MPTAAQGHRTKPKHKLKKQHKQHSGCGEGVKGERTKSKLKQTGKKKKSGWGRYHGRLHWGCFFCSAYYTGFVVALWLRQKNMFLVLLLGKDSKKKTALLQLQPCLHTPPSPPSQTRRGRKEECCPDCWTSSLPQRQQMLQGKYQIPNVHGLQEL